MKDWKQKHGDKFNFDFNTEDIKNWFDFKLPELKEIKKDIADKKESLKDKFSEKIGGMKEMKESLEEKAEELNEKKEGFMSKMIHSVT